VSTREYLDKDLYAVLGLTKGAPQADIKKAYRRLAKELHPDQNKNNPEAEAKFKEVSEAYSVLGDEAKRKEYDEGRELFGNGGFRNAGGHRGGAPGGTNFEFNFGGGGDGGLGDILGGIFNRRGQAGARRGADVETSVTVDFVQAVEGVTVPLRLTSERACATCAGTGAKSGTTPAGLPGVRRGRACQPQPRRVRDVRAVPGLPRTRSDRRRPVHDLPRQRARPELEDGQHPHSGRRRRRAKNQAQGQGCSRRARRTAR